MPPHTSAPTTSGLAVRPSKIHGHGLFATRSFAKGEMVVRWDLSNLLTKRQVNRLPKRELKYVSAYGKTRFILHVSPERFMNHSCEPNTRISHTGDVATRAIRRGEELTTDYRFEGGPVDLKHCHCGTIHCKKILNHGPVRRVKRAAPRSPQPL